MKLIYSEIKNFGDALNPYIFNRLMPGFFDGDEEQVMMGIGTILGKPMAPPQSAKYVFTSGIGIGNRKEYGKPLSYDSSYHFIAVRGPLTASVLKLHPKLALTDGACLVRMLPVPRFEKKYPFSFIPHKSSESKFPWQIVCKQAGIHYISPRESVDTVIREILRSGIVIAEAMHGAIVADALRIPWIACRTSSTINAFKWKDWMLSLKLDYRPFELPGLYEKQFLKQIILNRTSFPLVDKFVNFLVGSYDAFQRNFLVEKAVDRLIKVQKTNALLSDESLLKSKTDRTCDLLFNLRKKAFRSA